MSEIVELKRVDGSGELVKKGESQHGFIVNMSDPDALNFVDAKKKAAEKSGQGVVYSDAADPEPAKSEPAKTAKTVEAGKETSEPVKVAEKPAKR